MNRPLRNERLFRFFSSVFFPGDAGAITLADGTALHIQYQELPDLGTFPRIGQTLSRYFRIAPGQTLLLNDPEAGGSTLSQLTFVHSLSLEDRKDTDILLILRTPTRPRLSMGSSLDSEGLRIPPTPIAENSEIIKPVWEAISQAPGAAPELGEQIQKGVQRVLAAAQRFNRGLQTFELQLNRTAITNFLAASRHLGRAALHDLSVGETEVLIQLKPQVRIRLRLEISDKKTVFDFTGTQDLPELGLSEASTFGACMGALSASLPRFPLNSGAFSLIDVLTPAGSLLNARYPRPAFVGVSQLAPLVAEMALKAIGQISPTHIVAMNNPTRTLLTLVFDQGLSFFDDALPGTGASPREKGETGLLCWRRSTLQPSIEEIERRFPILVTQISRRENSGGHGQWPGGDGLIRTYKLLRPAQARWCSFPEIPAEGSGGGGPGDPGHVEIQLPGEDFTRMESLGQKDLPADSKIRLFSGGGGGYGRRPSS